jgi:hypothetical protein
VIDADSQKVRLRLYLGNSPTPIDVSPLFEGGNGGDSHLLENGIISHSATLELSAYPLDSSLLSELGISTDPRVDPDVWAEGNKITIEIRNASDDGWILHKTLRIAKPPRPPKPLQRPTLTIELTDYLGAAIDNSGAGDGSEVELGTATPKGTVVSTLLAKVGLTASVSIPGTLDYPPQKLDPSGYLQQAGQIAYSSFRALFCQPDGAIAAQEIALDLPVLGTYSIGQDELDFDALETPFSPPFKVIVNSVAHSVKPIQDSYQVTFTEQAPAITIDPNADDEEFILVKSTTESGAWSGSQYQVVTTVSECASLVYPWWGGDPTTLVWSRTTTKTESYSGGTEGELIRETLRETRPLGAAMPVFVARQEDRDSIQDQVQTTLLRVTDYEYSEGETQSISSYTREPFGVLLPDENYSGEGETVDIRELTTTESNKQEWTRLYEGAYRFRESPKRCVARAYPSLVSNLDTIDQKVRLVALESTTREANNGSTHPPAPRRRKPLRDWQQTPISGEAEFETLAGYQGVRERPYDLPYCSESSLASHAELIGTRLWGEPLGISAQLPLSDEFKGNVPPIGRIRFVHPDGVTREYLYHALVWEISQRGSFVGLEGFYLGEVTGGVNEVVTPPVKRITKLVGATAIAARGTTKLRRAVRLVGATAIGGTGTYLEELQIGEVGSATGVQGVTVDQTSLAGTATGVQGTTVDQIGVVSSATGAQGTNPPVQVVEIEGATATGVQGTTVDQIGVVSSATGAQGTNTALVDKFLVIGSTASSFGFGSSLTSLSTFSSPLTNGVAANGVAVRHETGTVILAGASTNGFGRFARGNLNSDLSNPANWTNSASAGSASLDDVIHVAGEIWFAVPVSAGVAQRSTNDGVSWSSVTLPGSPNSARGVGTNGNGGVLVCASSYAVYSSDYGATFSSVTAPYSTICESVAFNAGRWFAGYSSGRIAWSDDNGASWTVFISGFGANTFWCIFPVSSTVVLACSAGATNAGRIYRSTNNGTSWTDLGQVMSSSRSIRWIDGTPNSLTAIATDGTFVQSSDLGATWSSVQSTGLSSVNKFAIGKTSV